VENLKTGNTVGSCVTSTGSDAGKMVAEAAAAILEEVRCFLAFGSFKLDI